MLHGVENGASWPLFPSAGRGGACISRDDPGCGEGAKMIDPEHVDLQERGPDSIDPPGVASFGVALPVIDRISPELPLSGESIGRNARHDRGTSLPIEPEQVSVRPDIGTVVGDENR